MEGETSYDSDSGRASKRARLSSPSYRSTSSRTATSRSTPFRPYATILKALPVEALGIDDTANISEPDASKPSAPWRKAVGAQWIALEYGALWGEQYEGEEAELRGEIIREMCSAFSDPHEWHERLLKWREAADTQEENSVGMELILDGTEGQAEVMLDLEPGSMAEVKDTWRAKYVSLHLLSSIQLIDSQVCWNCQKTGHVLASCPEPRNPLQIQLSRESFQAHKDAIPVEHLRSWDDYIFDSDERERRLELSRRFQPGRISVELVDALFDVDLDAELRQKGIHDAEDADTYEHYRREEVRVQRKQGKLDWLLRIAHWGYPPGWIAGKGVCSC